MVHAMLQRPFGRELSFISILLLAALHVGAAAAQGVNLARCQGLWFSTSEDFLSRGTDLPGGQVVSDGDLLSFTLGAGSQLCARNAELLQRFDTNRVDHGLDALEQIPVDPDRVVAAFSTEIDSVNGAGQFTAGDLLFTSGAVVPNVALLIKFGLPQQLNLGLDAVSIEGAPQEKRALLGRIEALAPDELRRNPALLIDLLDATNTDILFSTEGTPPDVQKPQFLDGDLLSAKTGTIVRSNADLLAALPAGIPDRGVDYGLDAYTPALDPIELVPIELLSTEIQAKDKALSDGDALTLGPGLFLRNIDLIKSFEPLDTDMGLDALAAGTAVTGCGAFITALSDIYVADIDPATGLFDDPAPIPPGVSERPFGRDVRIQGVVPGDACPEFTTHEFQVRVAVDGAPPVAILHPAVQGWKRDVLPTCNGNDLYETDTGGGWFRLTDYWRFGECPDDASLAIWRSITAPGADFATFQIVMRPIGGGVETFSPPVRIRVDNEAPHDLLAELYNAGATAPFGDQCQIDFAGADIVIDIKGRARDEHFSVYELYWTGGDVHTWRTIPPVLSQRHDGGRPDLGFLGTEPPAATDVPLGTLNLTAEYAAATGGDPVIECGYTVRLRAVDRSHRGSFNFALNAFSHVGGNEAEYMQSFCLHP